MASPVEAKVQASTAVAAVSGLALWALGRYVFKGDVPDVVASWVYVLVPGVLTFTAGYLARHTPRPDVPPPAVPSNVTVTPPAEKTLIPPAATE
jgi:hypothetical protein